MAVGRIQQGGNFFCQFVVVLFGFLAGGQAGNIQQAVFAVCERGGADRLPHAAVCQQTRRLLKSVKILAHRQSTGSQDHGLLLPPEGLPKLVSQIRHGGAQHRAPMRVLCCVKNHVLLLLQEQRHLILQLIQLQLCPVSQHGSDLLLDQCQSSMWPCQEGDEMRKWPSPIPGAGQFPKRRSYRLLQGLRSKDIPFSPQRPDQGSQLCCCQCGAKHLSGCLRQLVSLVQNQGAPLRDQRPASQAPVDRVCQQQIVVADLHLVPIRGTYLHEALIPAALPSAVADLGHADTGSVISAEVLGHVQIQVIPEGQQGLSGPRAFFGQIHRLQAPLQTLVAHIVVFPLSKHCPDGVLGHLVLYQHRGEKGQVFIQHRVLQGNAGGGNENWPVRQAPGSAAAEKHDAGHQVGVGLSNPCPGVAQCDAAIQHGVQHLVAQSDLGRTLRHAAGGE